MKTMAALILSLLVLAACAPGTGESGEKTSATSQVSSADQKTAGEALPSAGYDEAADPEAQLAAAVAEARASGRRILLEIGGEWCVWCRILEKYLQDHPEVHEALEASFVVVKINYSQDNPNEAFLARYPEIEGYPHMFVLDAAGQLLHSQNTAELEAGHSYDREKLLAFIERWGPEEAGSGDGAPDA